MWDESHHISLSFVVNGKVQQMYAFDPYWDTNT